jgi:hypothetical protein
MMRRPGQGIDDRGSANRRADRQAPAINLQSSDQFGRLLFAGGFFS